LQIAREEPGFAKTDGNISYSNFHVNSAKELTNLVDGGNTPGIAADPLLNFLDLIL
jgi:hypothetical protein